MAKQAHLPIIMVEYAGSGPTTPELKAAVDGYDRLSTVPKNTDGVFDMNNMYKGQLATALTNNKVKHLIVAGANGGACVRESIVGALASNCDVTTFGDGIADFNFKKFITPYRYGPPELQQFNLARTRCFGCTFKQVKTAEQLSAYVPGSKPPAVIDDDASASH